MTDATGATVRLPARTLLDCHDFDVTATLSGRIRRVGGQTHIEVLVDGKPVWVKPRNVYLENEPLEVGDFLWGQIVQ